MKKLAQSFLLFSSILFLAIFSTVNIAAVEDEVGAQPNYDKPIYMAYYRTWRDAEMPHDSNSNLPDANVIRMTDLPEEIDIVSVFHYVNAGTDQQKFWDTLRDDYVPTLHSRGQRVVRTLDFRELLKITEATGKQADTLTDEDYDNFAKAIIATYLTPWNLDGLDIDMESWLNPSQVKILGNVFEKLSDLLQIKEGSKNLLIYDTNRDNHDLFKEIAPHISYLFIQAYGRNPNSLEGTWSTYATDISSTKVLFGISFYEEQDGTNWNDAVGPFSEEAYETSRAKAYADWQPQGGEKGGMFVYAVDRDGKSYQENTITMTDFAWTNRIHKSLLASVKTKIETVSVRYVNKDGDILEETSIEAAFGSIIKIPVLDFEGYEYKGDGVLLTHKVGRGFQEITVTYHKVVSPEVPEVPELPEVPEVPKPVVPKVPKPEVTKPTVTKPTVTKPVVEKPSVKETLPKTGVESRSFVMLGSGLLSIGTLLYYVSRRKRI